MGWGTSFLKSYEAASGRAREAAESVVSGAKWVGRKSAEAARKLKEIKDEKAEQFKNAAKKSAVKIKSKAAETAAQVNELKNKAAAKAEDIKQRAAGKADEIKGKAIDTAADAKEAAVGAYKSVNHFFNDTAPKAIKACPNAIRKSLNRKTQLAPNDDAFKAAYEGAGLSPEEAHRLLADKSGYTRQQAQAVFASDNQKLKEFFHYELRDELNSDVPQTLDDMEFIRNSGADEGWEKYPYSAAILHQNKDDDEYFKYVHSDGREVVYHSKKGHIINDPEYMGTFNYINAGDNIHDEMSKGHKALDVDPWLEFGNARDDSTITAERYKMLLGDTAGQKKAIKDTTEHLGKKGQNLYNSAKDKADQLEKKGQNFYNSIKKAWDK